MHFNNIEWIGTQPGEVGSNFQLIPNVENYSQNFGNCVPFIENMNGYYCETKGLGILLFESLDVDSWDRSIQPVYYRFEENEETQTKLNSY